MAKYQAYLDQLNGRLAATEGYDARKPILDEIAATARILEDIETNYARNCAHGPIPPPKFQIGAWQLQSPYGIRLSDNLWQTGSVWAAHPLPGECLLIGTEQAGLWLSEPDGSGSYKARCLSDTWDHWGISAFVADPANPDRIFVGANDTFSGAAVGIDGRAGGVYVGRASRLDDPWTFVPFPPGVPGGVLTMIILPGLRRLLVVTGIGVGANSNPIAWMDIDSSPFAWQVDPQTATDLANAGDDSFLITDQVNAVLGVCRFSGSSIVFNRTSAAAINWNSVPSSFTPMRIASCKAKPTTAYCLGYVGNLQSLFVIRSIDGGNSWTECVYSEANTPVAFSFALDAFDSGVKSRYSIAVHPTDPLTVAVGFGAAALSNDGGSGQWLALNNIGAKPVVPMHADIHELCFDEANGILFVPSDGGLLSLPSLTWLIVGPSLLPWVSAAFFPGDTRRNRTLPVVMLDSNPPRGSLANIAIGGEIVVTGTQDNANLWLDPASHAWSALEVVNDGVTGRPVSTSGDGGVVAISAQASGMFVFHGQGADNSAVQWARWEGSSWGPSSTVPVSSPTGLIAAGLLPQVMRPVSPAVGLFAPAPVIALASAPGNGAFAPNIVFGAIVFAFPTVPPFTPIPPQAFWVQLGSVPATESINALEAFDQSSVLAGTNSGRLFRVFVNGGFSEIFLDDNFGGQFAGEIGGIASDGNMVVCIKTDINARSYAYAGQPASVAGAGAPGRLNLLSAVAFPRNTGTRFFRSVCANRNSKFLRLSFAIGIDENEVWVSNSPLAAVWHEAFDGLPTAVRCSDLVFSENSTEGQLWLSTYGRGLWKLSF